ncbi:SusD/RagB family nutrient-binding outer membrane lipoprotein [Chitinophaga sp. GCM10012297]|uniref:SusD/RagB family nutrient-binding outer membrane lipoprotein n=1 Tax=Chitinophaga chungangae TaxID=2821488 RepID=A0ABS3YEC8_9BACT|nr:SusD/RagB family nutrient-binding outer membrane lipoprotein [Chitinophaga chungangae]MBO9153018.1 SusD/RagB family nutrient-binding outer membrane lipoprotein [Chitinophaga chungangae]
MKSYYNFLVCLGLMMVGCNDFGDMNTNPTQSTTMDPALQLVQVQARFSGDLESNERVSTFMCMPMVQQLGGAWACQYGGFYVKQQQYMSILWELNYTNDVLNLVDAVNRAKDDPKKPNLYNILRIMKVYLFARLTDLYGDIPYSEASAGYTQKIVRPKYDRQEDIYNDFFKELTEASIALDASRDNVANDQFYKGDIGKWKKFANSLHLRLAMRLVKRDAAKAKTEAEKAFARGVFEGNEDICKMTHANILNNYADVRGNGLSASISQGEVVPYRFNQVFIDALRNTNDPRLNYIAKYYIDKPYAFMERTDITNEVKAVVGYTACKNGDFVWDDWKNTFTIQVPGLGAYDVGNNTQKLQLANFLIANDAPFLHLTYAETELLLAEACFRWSLNLNGDFMAHYNRGIEAAMKQLAIYSGGPQIGDTEINKYKTDNVIAPGQELAMINHQLWVALFMNGPEAYANWRRSGFPVLTPGYKPGYSSINSIPRRFEYPLSEKEQNADNYNKAVQAMDGKTDDWTGRVWWDKQ